MKTFLKILGYGVAVATIVAGSWYGYGYSKKKADPPATAKGAGAVPVRTETVQLGCVTNMIKLIGTLEATRTVDVVPKLEGRLDRLALDDGIPVLEGTPVKRLQIMAVIDHRAIMAQLEECKAAVETARTAIDTAKVVLKDRDRERKRMEKLFSEGSTTEQQRDLAVTAYEQSVTGLAQAKAQLAQAQAAADVVEVNLTEAFIHAPMDGVVSAKYVDAGAMVNGQTRIVQVIPMDELKYLIAVPGPYLHLLTTGKTHVSVVSDAVPDRVFTGVISRIYPVVDPVTRTATVEVRLANERNEAGEWLLRPGLYAEGRIILEARADVVVIPADVALRRGTRFLAFVIEGGKARTCELKVGIRDGNRIEVVEGLAPGEQLVVMGQHRLTNGASVRLTDGEDGRKGQ